jgi:SAM-dependent methyltransferase
MATVAALREPAALSAIEEAACAYDALGEEYLHYADGDTQDLFAFEGPYGFADREVWARIDAALVDLRAQGRNSLRILDLGCGPGTWLIRTVLRAHALGFGTVVARGIDVSQELIGLARDTSRRAAKAGLELDFEVADILSALANVQDRSIDLTLWLYGVLNHLPVNFHSKAAAELSRVTGGCLIVTVRSADSLPSIFVAGMEAAQSFHYDAMSDRLEIDLKDGRHIGFNFHLFTAAEISAHFSRHLSLSEVTGIDLFHSRFAPERCWNHSQENSEFRHRLTGLERLCCSDPALIDHAAHILVVGRPVTDTN